MELPPDLSLDQGTSKRRYSMELPPHLSNLRRENVATYVKHFDTKQIRMEAIAHRLSETANEVQKIHKNKDTARRTVRRLLVLVIVGIIAAPLTGSLSLWLSAAIGSVVLTTTLYKTMKERGSTNTVNELGEEFLTIVKPQTNSLDEILKAYKESNIDASRVMTQAETSLSDAAELKRLLEEVTELSAVSTDLSDLSTLSANLGQIIVRLVLLVIGIVRVTPTPEQDIKLRDIVIKSAEQCKKTVSEFQRMKCLLQNYE